MVSDESIIFSNTSVKKMTNTFRVTFMRFEEWETAILMVENMTKTQTWEFKDESSLSQRYLADEIRES